MNDGTSTTASSDRSVSYVGGAAMYPTKNIVENAQASPIHTTLVKAVVAADLATTLSGPGPFTVFAPTDDAFAKVPAATVNSLMQPAMKPTLAKVLTYHVVPGRVTSADIAARIRAGNRDLHHGPERSPDLLDDGQPRDAARHGRLDGPCHPG